LPVIERATGNQTERTRRGQWLLLAGFVVLAALISVLAYWAWAQQSDALTGQAERSLQAVADLKAGQIAAWSAERVGDAEVVRDDKLLSAAITDLLAGRDAAVSAAHIRSYLDQIRRSYGYLDLELVDPGGRAIMRVPANEHHPLGARVRALIAQAERTRQVVSSDLYLDPEGTARIELIAPVLAQLPGDQPVASIVTHVDPALFLYPFIQEWPLPSDTGETLLVERQRDRVVFLNELRHRHGTALRLSVPASDPDLPAAMAVRGRDGIVEGLDYRDVPVMAAIAPVPGTDWKVVAKVDRSEVLDPIRERAWLTVGFTLAVVGLAAIATLLLWRLRERQVNAKLVASEGRYRSLFETMAEGVALHEMIRDADGKPADYLVLDVNPAFSAQTGMSAATVGRAATDAYGTPEAPYLDVYAHVVETGRADRFESYFAPLERHFEVSVVPQDADRFATIFQDVTERVTREAELLASEQRFRYVFDNALVGMSVTSPTGEVDVNAAYCKMLGYAREEVRHKRWQDLTPPGDIAATQAHLDRLLAGEADSARYLKRYVHKDGSMVWADVSTTLRRDEAGQPLHFITAVVDITQRKLAEQEIERLNAELEQRVFDRTAALDAANKELEAFAYSVSHDLRAPLRHVSDFSTLLAERSGDQLDEKSRHYVEVISTSVRQMGVLIDDLLQFSRTGRAELTIEPVDMDATLAQALEPLQRETDGRDVEWTIDPLPRVIADRALLRQVWANLVGNALKYTRGRSPATIEIGAAGVDGRFVFYIRDNGVGFDMQYAHKLFGVFQRLHSDAEFEGTGIGLANVRRIVTRLGGAVWAEAEPGSGATFYFSLPDRKEPTS